MRVGDGAVINFSFSSELRQTDGEDSDYISGINERANRWRRAHSVWMKMSAFNVNIADAENDLGCICVRFRLAEQTACGFIVRGTSVSFI